MFVILAILVLAVSFVLAVLSLVKEQNKLVQATKLQDNPAEKKTKVNKEKTQAIINPEKNKLSQPVQAIGNKFASNEEQTIEEIRAELAKIVQEGEIETRVSETENMKAEPLQDQKSPKVVNFGQNLSGEISIRDINNNE